MKELKKVYQILMWVGPLTTTIGAFLSNEHEFKGLPIIFIGLVFLVLGFLYIKNLLVSNITLGLVFLASTYLFLVPLFNSFEMVEFGVLRFVFYWLGLLMTVIGNGLALKENLQKK